MGETWVGVAQFWLAEARTFFAGSPIVAALIATNLLAALLWISALARARSARRKAARLESDHAALLLTYEKEKMWRSAHAGAEPALPGARTQIDG